MKCEPLEPRRIRHPRGAYGWTDLKIVTEGYLERLGPQSAFTYLFLCAVGNCQGMSFWSHVRMARILRLTPEVVQEAVKRLVDENLVASNGRVVQVLPIPDRVPAATANLGEISPRTSMGTPSVEPVQERAVDEADILKHEPEALAQLSRFLGRRPPKASALRALAKALALKTSRTAGGQENKAASRRG
jgi:hypothetical protein